MDQVNTMKYDELTLMQFADGELDEGLTAEIESARANDKELQSYLEVYETTRNALIESNDEETIPSHINDLIDSFGSAKKQNWLANIVKNNPFKASVFSAMLASLVTFQSVLIATGGMFTTTQLATRGIEVTPDINGFIQNINNDGSVFRAASSVNVSSKDLIEKEINKALLVDQNVSQVIIKLGVNIKTLSFLKRFTDTKGNNCKVAQIDDQYLIACKEDNSDWIIRSY
jgi:hypothetical protein